MIRETSGNLLMAPAEALINTVNTVGVMGKGIALQFKRAYPAMYLEYERAAKAGELAPGRVQVWESDLLQGPRYIINFPTKRHWRGSSKLEYIERGLDDLARVIRDLGVKSIAVPPLGCGNGGLDWAEVKPLIERKLGSLEVDVLLYPPAGAPKAAAMVDRRPKPRMTRGRAALLTIMQAYQRATWDAPSLIEIQKLMYFLQESGEPLRLDYVKGRYGPYADNLRHVLAELEGHYLSGFGDGSARVAEAEPLAVLNADDPSITRELAAHPETMERVERVMELVEGYETPYGMELLATVHWVNHHSTAGGDQKHASQTIAAWSERKQRMFTPQHIERAWTSLQTRGAIVTPA
ncbi:MAG: macro domain-containing protein [Propionibacteriaceae bacterium]|nr:macro domain-containing protein [Propionibacteriaceae bacterium]